MDKPKNYVKKHKGHDVPDGATHYYKGCDTYYEAFYYADGDDVMFFKIGTTAWDRSNMNMPAQAIELPEQDLTNWDDAPEWADRYVFSAFSGNYFFGDGVHVLNAGHKVVLVHDDIELVEMRPIATDKEWLPTINNRCIHIYGGGLPSRQEEEVFIVGIDKLGNYVFQNDSSECYYSDPSSEFRPLKTAEELERDAFIEAAVTVMNNSIDDSQAGWVMALHKAGFTAPKGEG